MSEGRGKPVKHYNFALEPNYKPKEITERTQKGGKMLSNNHLQVNVFSSIYSIIFFKFVISDNADS